MAKVLTVAEALDHIKGKVNEKGEMVNNRFSKKNFNTLVLALANDVDFNVDVAKKVGDNCDLEEVMVTKEFRKWVKKLVEKFGVDSKDSERALTNDFVIDNVDGLYEFFSTAIYEYMQAGNRFDLPNREDFQGGFVLKTIPETSREYEAKNPKDQSVIGTFKATKKKHKVVVAKSSCPDYLSTKVKLK